MIRIPKRQITAEEIFAQPAFGWAKDDKIIELRNQFMRETDDAKKKKLADAIQARAFEIGTHVPLGEYTQPMAARKNISGFFITNGNIYAPVMMIAEKAADIILGHTPLPPDPLEYYRHKGVERT